MVSALPGALFAFGMVLFNASGVSWHAQRSGGNVLLLHLLLVPLYLVLFVGSFARRSHPALPATVATSARRRIPGPLIVLGGFVGLSVVVGWLDAPPPESPVAQHDLSTTGCTNAPRDVSRTPGGVYYVVVFNRLCAAESRSTVNVSVVRGTDPDGPGNVFIAQPTPGREPSRLQVFATSGPDGGVVVAYDTGVRVIKREALVEGRTIRYSPVAFDRP